MKTKTIIAIDPGSKGGIAIKHGEQRPYAVALPETEGDIIGLFAEMRLMAQAESRETVAVIEQVPTFAGNAARGNSQAVLYGGYKFMLGALQATHWRIELVRPQKWQKVFALGTRKDCGEGSAGQTEWKNKLKTKAQQLFPELKVTLSTSDALLLMEYFTRYGSTVTPIAE